MIKSMIENAIDQQKKIKQCELSPIGHVFQFDSNRKIENIGDNTEYKFYLCINCGLGKFI